MSGGDYVRQMPEVSSDLAQRSSLAQRFHIDLPLLVLLLALTVFGLLVLYSASGQSMPAVLRQVRFFGVAYVGMFVMAQIKVRQYQRWAPWLYLLGGILLAAVLVAGTGAKGAQRWLSIGGFRFQPSELLKLMVPLTLASYLASRPLPPRFKHVVVSLVLVGLPGALIMLQPDLGTGLIVLASGLIVLFMSGIGWGYLLWALILAAASAWPAWQFMLHDYQKQRILTLFNPDMDKLGSGWNIIQSKTAIGSGGWQGKGWLQGTQSRLDFLPESHTDFVIAVLGEEFGLRGVLILLGLYLLIVLRGLWIGLQAQDSFGRLAAGSITLTFFVYVFVNMGMVSGLLPVVGVPLPLISAGGTSLVTLMGGFGVLMAISTDTRRLR